MLPLIVSFQQDSCRRDNFLNLIMLCWTLCHRLHLQGEDGQSMFLIEDAQNMFFTCVVMEIPKPILFTVVWFEDNAFADAWTMPNGSCFQPDKAGGKCRVLQEAKARAEPAQGTFSEIGVNRWLRTRTWLHVFLAVLESCNRRPALRVTCLVSWRPGMCGSQGKG